jgi:hypothetical protein
MMVGFMAVFNTVFSGKGLDCFHSGIGQEVFAFQVGVHHFQVVGVGENIER